MWVQVTCPNGHVLRVQSKYAGKTGTCPDCKQQVMVPDLTEIIAMETLGDSVLSGGDEKKPTEVAVGPLSSGMALGPASSMAVNDSALAKQSKESMRECPAC